MVTHQSQHTGDALMDRVQNNVRALINALKLVPFIFGGKLVSVTFVGGVQKNIRHGLGVPAAFIVVRHYGTSGARIAEYPAATQETLDQRNVLAVTTDDDCTLDLWFYPRSSRDIDAATGQSA